MLEPTPHDWLYNLDFSGFLRDPEEVEDLPLADRRKPRALLALLEVLRALEAQQNAPATKGDLVRLFRCIAEIQAAHHQDLSGQVYRFGLHMGYDDSGRERTV